jgi:predicted DNA-binding transcriptional regulator YafY
MEVSARLLRLLSALETGHDLTATALAQRLGVTARTVRNDIARLRGLGYGVRATRGRAGGYRLVPGAHRPPLMLDDDEVVAAVVALRHAAAGSPHGLERPSLGALLKLERVLAPPLREQADATTRVAVPRRSAPRSGRRTPAALDPREPPSRPGPPPR